MDYLRFTYSHKYFAHIVFVVIILIILVYISKAQKRELRTDGSQPSKDGNGSLYFRGRSDPADEIGTILQRISWNATLFKRTSQWQRAFVTAVIITVLLTFVIFFGKLGQRDRNLPPLTLIVSTLIIVFIVTLFVPNFLFTHGDVYATGYTREGAKIIAKKLNLNVDLKADPPKPLSDIPPDRTDITV